MENKLKKLIELTKHLPENKLEEAIEKLEKIKEESEKEAKLGVPKCVKCGGTAVVRNGRKHNRQQYLCRECGKSFCETTDSAVFRSHSTKTVWKQVIEDTIAGIPIDDTAKNLDLHHETVFNMRHKILYSLEQSQKMNPISLEGVCEADETYVLESVKGKKIPLNYHRKPRKHGAKAQKRGISNEYICICAAVERGGKAFSLAANRAIPSKDEILEVFSDHVSGETLLLHDGTKNYEILSEADKCVTAAASIENEGLNNINTVNNYHSFIKERYHMARGFATSYLNRYNALFSAVYRSSDSLAEDIYNLMTDMSQSFVSISQTQSENLLEI